MTARFLLRLATALLPVGAGRWADAMRGELAAIACPWARLTWASGCLVASLRMRAQANEGRFELTCAVFLAALTLLDWRSPDPAATLTLLATAAAVLAFLYPGRQQAIGALFGLWLLAAHGLADLIGVWRPLYQGQPLATAELLEIAALLILTLPAAASGAALGRVAGSRRTSFLL